MRKIVSLILAIIPVLGLCVTDSKAEIFVDGLSGNSPIFVFIYFIFVIFIYKALQIKDKRLIICALAVSVLLSLFQTLGINTADQDYKLQFLILMFFEYLILIYSLLVLVFNFLRQKEEQNENHENKKIIFFTNNKRSILIVGFVIFALWVPYLLMHYPGIIGFDSMHQIKQVIGAIPFNAGHPILHTFMIDGFLQIGINIFNDINLGVALYSITQLLIMAFTFSYFIYFLAKKGVSNTVRFIALIFFAINPMFPLFGISLIKDTMFGVMIFIDLILLIEFVTDKEKFLHSKSKIIIAAICIILTCLFRYNGLYAFILLVPFILIFVRKYYVKIIAFFLAVFAIIWALNGPVLEYFKLARTSDQASMLSIPLQGIARTVKYVEGDLSEEQKEQISKFLDYDKIASDYNPDVSDRMSDILDRKYFEEHKGEFINLYLGILAEHPDICIQSVLCNTSGYWFPEKIKLIFVRSVYENEYGIESKKLLNNETLEDFDKSIEDRKIPVYSMFFSIGFCTWVLLIALAYAFYRKRYNLCIVFLPIIFIYLTIIAGPSNTEFRYVFQMYICAPLLVIMSFFINQNSINKKKTKISLNKNGKTKKYVKIKEEIKNETGNETEK